MSFILFCDCHKHLITVQTHANILGFKLLLCCERCILSFGWFPSVWILYANVSEHSVCSIFIGHVTKMEKTECSETLEHNIQTLGSHPKERIQHVLIWISQSKKSSTLQACFSWVSYPVKPTDFLRRKNNAYQTTCVCVSQHSNFWTTWPIYTKFGTDIKPQEASKILHFLTFCTQ
jgi:hypothetical protein